MDGSAATAAAPARLTPPRHTAAASKRAEATSVRATALEIGMSRTAFRHFLKGGKPHPSTREKLVMWYAVYRSGRAGELATADAQAAVSLLRRFLDGSTSRRIREARLADIIRELSD